MVLFNGMAQTTPWAALYFVLLMTFGNYVLFNLLVAILVEGFQESKEEERKQQVHIFVKLFASDIYYCISVTTCYWALLFLEVPICNIKHNVYLKIFSIIHSTNIRIRMR